MTRSDMGHDKSWHIFTRLTFLPAFDKNTYANYRRFPLIISYYYTKKKHIQKEGIENRIPRLSSDRSNHHTTTYLDTNWCWIMSGSFIVFNRFITITTFKQSSQSLQCHHTPCFFAVFFQNKIEFHVNFFSLIHDLGHTW